MYLSSSILSSTYPCSETVHEDAKSIHCICVGECNVTIIVEASVICIL